jgi:hypothetical protein
MPALNSFSHDTGQSHLTAWTPELVAAAPDPVRAFALYAQQVLGVPFYTTKDLVLLRQRVNDVFNRCPQATYYTLCRVVAWARRKRIRKPRVYMIIDLVPEATAAAPAGASSPTRAPTAEPCCSISRSSASAGPVSTVPSPAIVTCMRTRREEDRGVH